MDHVSAHPPHPVEHEHPPEKLYIKIAILLAVLTAIEVALYYVKAGSLNTPVLIVLMIAKFFFVAGYFMHLKFDSRIFRRFFILGIVLATAIYTIVLLSFLLTVFKK
jgi:cytochrome c oxidase subunit IV